MTRSWSLLALLLVVLLVIAAGAMADGTQTPTAVIVTGPPADGYTSDSTPAFTFSSDHPDSTFECSLDDGPYEPCGDPGGSETTPPLSDGWHSLFVRATAGGETGASDVRGFTVDTDPPETTITRGPADETTDDSPLFVFKGTFPIDYYQCSLDGAAFATCNGREFQAVKLALGSHTFDVRAVDLAGNLDPTPAHTDFNVVAPPPDDTPPDDTPPDTGPPDVTPGQPVALKLRMNYARRSASGLLHDGVVVTATCAEDCVARLEVQVPAKLAHRLGLGSRVIGTARANLGAASPTRMTVRVSKRAAQAIGRNRSTTVPCAVRGSAKTP